MQLTAAQKEILARIEAAGSGGLILDKQTTSVNALLRKGLVTRVDVEIVPATKFYTERLFTHTLRGRLRYVTLSRYTAIQRNPSVMGEVVMGIRPYGHGKFHTLIDSYAYAVTLDGGADEEESYEEGGGWYGLLWIDDDSADTIRKNALDAEVLGEGLNRDEERLLDESVAVIFFERSDGIVDADWFGNKQDAEAAWEEIQELFENEGDE